MYIIAINRPDYYVKQLLAKISGMINTTSGDLNDKTSGVAAIMVDTLGFLCESQVIDMHSTWEELLPKFKQEKRHLYNNKFF
jgi:hypothetical protein